MSAVDEPDENTCTLDPPSRHIAYFATGWFWQAMLRTAYAVTPNPPGAPKWQTDPHERAKLFSKAIP